MSRQPSTYTLPMTPVTPLWAGGHDMRSVQRQRLLPSAIEMTTPPQTVPRKVAGTVVQQSQMPPMPTFPTAIGAPGMAAPGNMHTNMPTNIPTNVPVPMGMPESTMSPQIAPSMNGYNAAIDQQGNAEAPPYGMMEMPSHIYPPPPQSHAYGSQSDMTPMSSNVPQYSQNSFPHDRYQGSYPSLRTSYAQYYPESMASQSPHSAASPMARYPTGRVSKIPTRSHHHSGLAASNSSGYMMPAAMSNYHGGHMESFQSGYKDRFAAYNHYILRHAAEEKSKVIWSAEVEAAFMEAVWLIPGDSCKILMERRTRGRNELISDFLKHKLGEARSRKQVSSHLQVLKKLLRDDEEFLEHVGPKKTENLQKAGAAKTRPDMAASSIAQLITKLKLAKRNQPKPAFLLQAEANLDQSRREEMKLSSHESISSSHSNMENAKIPIHNSSSGMQYSHDITDAPQTLPPHPHLHLPQTRAQIPKMEHISNPSGATDNQHSESIAADTNQSTPGHHTNEIKRLDSTDTTAVGSSSTPGHDQEPPLRHPRPVHPDNLEVYTVDPVVAPSASVPPPKDLEEVAVSPRRHHPQHYRQHSRHHRRTTSASVDLTGDKVLPIQFKMVRNTENNQFVYSRLLRATYESPTRPLELHQLTPKFTDLAKLESENQLAGAQVVHANVALYVKPRDLPDPQTIRDQYSSDVQFVVTCDTANSLHHRYITKTVITSRSAELLRCELPCMFQRLGGRGLEVDKEVVNVPFLPDFWADFLARLNSSDHEYVQAALSALTMHQAIYRVNNDQEELCFVSLYQFSAAEDEFSARTRFRRVKGVPPASTSGNSNDLTRQSFKDGSTYPSSPHPHHTGGSNAIPAIREPSTPTRSGHSAQRNLEQTPKPIGTPALLGIGTPGQALGSLGNLINCESPSMFASPRRLNTIENIELGASPFTAVISNESRGSPRSLKFEIQRAMTAFEPSAWDEMHDWIYQ